MIFFPCFLGVGNISSGSLQKRRQKDCSESEVVNDTKINVFQKRQYRYPHEQRLCGHVANLDRLKVQNWEGGVSGHKVPSLSKKHVTDTYWDGENRFSPVECHWLYHPHSRADPIPWSSWPNKKMESILLKKKKKRIEAELVLVKIQENSLPAFGHILIWWREKPLQFLPLMRSRISPTSMVVLTHIKIYNFNLRNLEGRKSFQG